jgi:hypothetical protein
MGMKNCGLEVQTTCNGSIKRNLLKIQGLSKETIFSFLGGKSPPSFLDSGKKGVREKRNGMAAGAQEEIRRQNACPNSLIWMVPRPRKYWTGPPLPKRHKNMLQTSIQNDKKGFRDKRTSPFPSQIYIHPKSGEYNRFPSRIGLANSPKAPKGSSESPWSLHMISFWKITFINSPEVRGRLLNYKFAG